jgi:hypothetical protein
VAELPPRWHGNVQRAKACCGPQNRKQRRAATRRAPVGATQCYLRNRRRGMLRESFLDLSHAVTGYADMPASSGPSNQRARKRT